MSGLPTNPSESFKRRNPHLYPGDNSIAAQVARAGAGQSMISLLSESIQVERQKRKFVKPLLNKTEQRYCNILEAQGHKVLKQAITLRLDPPYKSYRPDLAYKGSAFTLFFVEVKGPHRFRKAGIAKAALAAKTYPQFCFMLADWVDGKFKESILTP